MRPAGMPRVTASLGLRSSIPAQETRRAETFAALRLFGCAMRADEPCVLLPAPAPRDGPGQGRLRAPVRFRTPPESIERANGCAMQRVCARLTAFSALPRTAQNALMDRCALPRARSPSPCLRDALAEGQSTSVIKQSDIATLLVATGACNDTPHCMLYHARSVCSVSLSPFPMLSRDGRLRSAPSGIRHPREACVSRAAFIRPPWLRRAD